MRIPRVLRRLSLRHDSGVSTIEVVLLTPVFLSFILFIVAFGLIVDAQGQVNGVARDAARAGSLERSEPEADDTARHVAEHQLGSRCVGGPVVSHGHSHFKAGGLYAVQVQCSISLRPFNLIHIDAEKTVTGSSVAPLDMFRETH